MALDYLAFNRIISLISTSLENGRISKISQISNEEFLFIIRNGSVNYNLLVSTHANMSYINLVDNKPSSNQVTSNLLMLFRKHLEAGKIVSLKQLNDDRVVLMEVENRNDYFENTIHKLYIELIGRASNLILTNNDGIIIDSLKKIPLEYSNIRTILPGIKYTLPSKPSDEKLPYDLEKEIEYLSLSLNEIKDNIMNSDTIYITKKDDKKDFHFIPFTYLNGSVYSYKWNEGLEEFFRTNLDDERHRQLTNDLVKMLKNEVKRSEKKVKKLNEELEVNKEATLYKYQGDLLLTYMQGCKIDSDTIKVFDEMEDKEVTIKVNPLLDVYKNAQLLYKKYQKSKVALVKIKEQIDLCNDSIEYANTIIFQLANADVITTSQIKEELIEQGYLRKYIKQNNNNKKKVEKTYKPTMYRIDDVIVYAGQNNLQNEYLTFKIAKKNHMFLHVKDGPGAHVVIMSDNPSMEIIKKAAIIAAKHSLYKESSTVPINYTLIKNVKKIPGGKPGKVIIENYKTIYVDPCKH